MKIIRTLLLLQILLLSCKENKTYDTSQKKSIKAENMVENVLKKQLLQGSKEYLSQEGIEIPRTKFEDEDLNAVASLCKTELSNNGYIFISQAEFGNRIKNFFGRIIDFKSEKKFLYINNFDKCDKEMNYYPYNGIDYNGYYIVKNEKFIVNFYFIPEIVDYQKKYPLISKIETSANVSYKDQNNDLITKELWKDLPNLSQTRFQNNQMLINRNKYLFNDNKASLVWLKFNDKFFLESLVKTFGYVEDQDLLKYVLQNNYKKPEELQKVIWNQKCNDDIKFNQEVVDLIAASSIENQTKYLRAISDYIVFELKNSNSPLNDNFSKKAEILGKLAYHSEKIGEKIGLQFQFFKILGSEEGGIAYEEEFKKNNYYNIPDFQTFWEETKTGGISLPGME